MKGEKHDGQACAAAIVGDITPACGISKEKKAQLEADAIEDIQKLLGAESSVGTFSTAALQPHGLALHALDLISVNASNCLSSADTLLSAAHHHGWHLSVRLLSHGCRSRGEGAV